MMPGRHFRVTDSGSAPVSKPFVDGDSYRGRENSYTPSRSLSERERGACRSTTQSRHRWYERLRPATIEWSASSNRTREISLGGADMTKIISWLVFSFRLQLCR